MCYKCYQNLGITCGEYRMSKRTDLQLFWSIVKKKINMENVSAEIVMNKDILNNLLLRHSELWLIDEIGELFDKQELLSLLDLLKKKQHK